MKITSFVPKELARLFADIPIRVLSPGEIPPKPVFGIALDSRQVQPGSLFIAIEGRNVDGHRFIPMAIERGAVAVVGTRLIQGLSVPYVQVEDGRLALAYLSASFYNFPARDLTVIGVTGTDGKTTTANLIYQILMKAGLRAGIISTVNAVIGDEVVDTGFHVTTPEAPDVQHYLLQMVTAGLTHAVLEVTSHSLSQHRVTGCEFDIGVVTNITHEHLDEHGNFEAYRAAKGRLFTLLAETVKKPKRGNPRLAVLNRDDLSFDYLWEITDVRKISYSLQRGDNVDLWADHILHDAGGLHFNAMTPRFHIPLESNLVGNYNLSNILAALATTVVGLGVPHEAAREGVRAFPGVPGRMEPIAMGQDFTVLVDFAHTPNALKNVLETVRQMTGGRLIVVFGCAGLRDRQKRHLMAEVSIHLADLSIFTAEDPRTESLPAILSEMASAAEQYGGVEGKTFWRIPDRRDALRKAVSMARSGDLVMACGKGHEQSMCFGEVEYPWDDRTAMRAALAELIGVDGPDMPFLPDV